VKFSGELFFGDRPFFFLLDFKMAVSGFPLLKKLLKSLKKITACVVVFYNLSGR